MCKDVPKLCERDLHGGLKLKYEKKNETVIYYCAAMTDAILRQNKNCAKANFKI